MSVSTAENIARQMTQVLNEQPHWRVSEQQARQVRRALYQHLGASGIQNVPQVVNHIMALVGRDRA